MPPQNITPLSPSEKYTIRAIREANFLTLEEFADKVGVATLTVHKWETGENEPQMRNLRKVAEAFDLDPGQIVTGVDTRERRRT